MTIDELFAPDPDQLPQEARKKLVAHRAQLVDKYNVLLDEQGIHWTHSSAELQRRDITVPPIKHELDYWASIHEIGHVALQLPTFVDDKPAYENEVRVWVWSLANARITPSRLAACGMIRQLFTHTGDGHAAPGEDLVARLRDALPQARRR